MFASIVSKVSKLVRNAVRAVGVIVNRKPWLAPAAMLAVFFLM